MFCLEGTGAISHFSVRNNPELFNEPPFFAAIAVKGRPNLTRVVEGPIPDWKKFGQPNAAVGAPGATWGLARFQMADFSSRFPFATVRLGDPILPLAVEIKGWSPFIPTDADNSSLPVGSLEYRFTNRGNHAEQYVFSYNAKLSGGFDKVDSIKNGFILSHDAPADKPEDEVHFAVFTQESNTTVDHTWFRGGWFDPLTMAWNHIQQASVQEVPVGKDARGASLMISFSLKPGESRTIRLLMAWYAPHSKMRLMKDPVKAADSTVRDASKDLPSAYYQPWYSSKFANIYTVADYWGAHYDELRHHTQLFTDAFYRSSLPPEVLEAVAANLSILKSTTTLRQYDGKFWGWEGCEDNTGSCPGSCTHVWNYAQALCHLFPALERSMRETEFGESQDLAGHQMFRSALPIRPQAHEFYAAADGQLGGICKTYRDWRISGDDQWLHKIYPRVRQSMDYCIATWDPGHEGAVKEPHHNTYDIEFWGAEGLCTGFYCSALQAIIRMGEYMQEDMSTYRDLYARSKNYLETKLWNGQYFYQQTQWTGLRNLDPVTASRNSYGGSYSDEALAILKTEGPKYQYGTGCLSDGVLGEWMALVCGLPAPVDAQKIKTHLASVYRYNFEKDLSVHNNPQRPTYALGHEGGLLLCSWPRGGKPLLPFPYSDEVWTGIEYEVASHLIFMGMIREGLGIVRAARNRYDGRIRNPFDEYECGHWYARAMSSYALLEALTGVRYDAVEKTLYVDPKIGDFSSFLCTATGFGTVTCRQGKAMLQTVYGDIPVKKITVGKK